MKNKKDAGYRMQDEKKTESVKRGRYSHEDTKARMNTNLKEAGITLIYKMDKLFQQQYRSKIEFEKR
ncbi:MAG: hypothetical protein P9M00_08440 [Candidatus Tritonobacter lacicola]|nr:hypothetical protein [Candidatus Tritonobacter lacicola]